MIFCGCRNEVSSHFKIPELCSGQYGAWLSCHTRGGGTGPLGEPAMHFTCTWGASQVSLRSHALPRRGEIGLPCLGTVAGVGVEGCPSPLKHVPTQPKYLLGFHILS